MKNYLKLLLFTIVFLMVSNVGYSQYSSKKVRTKHEAYTDSLKQVKYDYIFPIFGQKVYQKGFDIPYPVGMMANSVWMKQDLIFTNFELGFEKDSEGIDIPLTPVDFIKFGQNSNNSQNYTFRPDVWVFPFLNVYGLFGAGTSKTTVELVAPINFSTEVEQEFSTKGLGVMLAGGVGPVWFSTDFNWTWNKPKLLDDPVKVTVMGIRAGHTIVFKNNPKSNIAFWVGAMRAKMASETVGQIALKDALPADFWDNKDQLVDDYYNWYDGLTKPEQILADQVLTPIVESIDAADGEGIVKYAMDKQTKQLWNGLIGAQYQLNKHWQIRTEAGVIGNRKSFLASVNYRFLL